MLTAARVNFILFLLLSSFLLPFPPSSFELQLANDRYFLSQALANNLHFGGRFSHQEPKEPFPYYCLAWLSTGASAGRDGPHRRTERFLAALDRRSSLTSEAGTTGYRRGNRRWSPRRRSQKEFVCLNAFFVIVPLPLGSSTLFFKIPLDFRPYLTPLFPHIFPSTVKSFILFP